MAKKQEEEKNENEKITSRKPYVKPQLERMNEKVGVVTGMPPVPGAAASAQASPIAPGTTVF